MSSTDYLKTIIQSQKQGKPLGICSICSANRFVLEAAMLEAKRNDAVVCVESTSNQVNQFGGYTGMTAADFAAYIAEVAREAGLPAERIILGGDHLGPNAWQKEPAKEAMPKAVELVRSCVAAGYTKIHLDASMRCADDPGDRHTPLDEKTITARAAELCAAAEAAHAELPKGSPAPLYIIGTEVPIPGGEQAAQEGIAVTRTDDAQRTIEMSRAAFVERGLEAAWERVIAVVVQPGVEFSDNHVFDYAREKARSLTQFISGQPNLVFEAHSTDYQTPRALRELVEDQFAILKVGPWVTFAFREAVFALAQIEAEWLGDKAGATLSRVREVLDEVMLERPGNWQPYYHGDQAYQRFARKYSYSDRSRYYWPVPKLDEAVQRLLANLRADPAPLNIVSQYLPEQYQAIREGRLANDPWQMIHDRIMRVTGYYARACRPT